MTAILDHVRDVLTLAGCDVNETRDLPHGWQLRCAGGEVVCVYRTGKVVAQGKNALAVDALFAAKPLPKTAALVKAKATVAASAKTGAPELKQDDFVSRFPPGWSWEPWDGLTAPF